MSDTERNKERMKERKVGRTQSTTSLWLMIVLGIELGTLEFQA